MIVVCEACRSKFNMDEDLIKEGGSKVRCSVCKKVFTVYPPEPESPEEQDLTSSPDKEALEETVALDSPPDLDGIGPDQDAETGEGAFDKALEEALEQEIEEAPVEESPGQLHVEEGAAGLEDEKTERLVQETADEEPSPGAVPAKKVPRGSKILLIILLIVLAFIIGALALFFFAPGLLPLKSVEPVKKEEVTDTSVRRLSFKDVSGSFVPSNKLGQLFVIRGEVVNENMRARSFILLKGSIYDGEGNRVRQKLIYAGNTFDEDQLRELSMEEIDMELKKESGQKNRNVNIQPMSSVPFMIVFENLPDNVGEFEVEAVSSSPAE
jgi:predicted Zn finger-like uncharacterized protein